MPIPTGLRLVTGNPRTPLGRSFWALCSATFVSGIGDGIVLTAAPLLATRLTDSAIAVSGLTAVAMLPWLLVGIQAGMLADRVHRIRLMVLVDSLRAPIVGVVAVAVVTEWYPLPVLYVSSLLLGIGATAFSAASSAVLPEVVDGRQLGTANGYLFAAEGASEQTAGRAIGGLLAAVSLSLPFYIDAVTFLASALLLQFVTLRPSTTPARPSSDATVEGSSVRESLRTFMSDTTLRALVGVISVLAGCQALVMAPLVLFALGPLGLTDQQFGLLLGVASSGGIAGGVAAGRIVERLGNARALVGSAVLAGSTYTVMGLAASPITTAVLFAIESFAIAIGNVASVTLRQRITPTTRLGVTGNIMRLFIFGVTPIAALLGGVLASASPRLPLLVAGVLQLLAVLGCARPLIRIIEARLAQIRGDAEDRPAPVTVDTSIGSLDQSGPWPRPEGLPRPIPKPSRHRYTGDWLEQGRTETPRLPDQA